MDKQFIKKHFEQIRSKYNLNWTTFEEDEVVLENDIIKIEIVKERFEPGLILFIVDKVRGEYYFPWDLEEKKGLLGPDDIFSPEELVFDQTLPDDDSIAFGFKVLLEFHFPDLLQGNFKEVHPGKKLSNPNYQNPT
ncbi:MAG: hypothetical protein H6581_27220 [Bacteroidia bacterium]|nr:hypothetical protein [Bacteroidia bacterium]